MSRHSLRVAALGAAVATWLVGVAATPAAFATASMSPTQAEIATEVTFSISATAGTLDVVTEVSADVPEALVYVGCTAPQGWACTAAAGGTGTLVTWSRSAADLDPQDPVLPLTLRMPEEPGSHVVTLSDQSQTGETSTSSVTIDVAAPAEPTEEPTEEPTAEPTPTETVTESHRPPPPVEPLRPPDDDSQTPIALGDERGPVPTSVVASPTPIPRARSLVQTAALPIAGLLLVSALSFLGAFALREGSAETADRPAAGRRD